MLRLATLADRPHFLRLWALHMAEQEKDGSHVTANMSNLYRCLDKFEAYAYGNQLGMTILYQPGSEDDPVGVCMAGELGVDEFETDLGRLATFWGVYVDPEYRGRGLGLKLFQEILAEGLRRGFDSVETYVRLNNPHGQRMAEAFGCTPYMKQYIAPLRDPKILTSDEAQKALAREVTDG